MTLQSEGSALMMCKLKPMEEKTVKKVENADSVKRIFIPNWESLYELVNYTKLDELARIERIR